MRSTARIGEDNDREQKYARIPVSRTLEELTGREINRDKVSMLVEMLDEVVALKVFLL